MSDRPVCPHHERVQVQAALKDHLDDDTARHMVQQIAKQCPACLATPPKETP